MIKERNNVTATTRDILVAISNRHTDDFFITECKNGPTQYVDEFLQMDAVAIRKSWARPCVSAYEVKSSRSDFMNDTKWPAYMAYCNQFSFACTEGLIKPEELPEEIGLYFLKPGNVRLRAVRKPLFRNVDIPSEFYLYIIFNHFRSDRIPFFSDHKAYFEAWLENKNENRRFGHHDIKSALTQAVVDMQEKVRDCEINELQAEKYGNLLKVMQKHGISTWHPDESLDETLSSRCSPGTLNSIERIEGELKRLKKCVGIQEEQ